jgi:hypothetical protein
MPCANALNSFDLITFILKVGDSTVANGVRVLVDCAAANL